MTYSRGSLGMGKKLSFFAFAVWSMILILGIGMTAFAADTKIDKVKVTFSYDGAPKSGDPIGSVDAAVSSDAEYVVESAEYVNDLETWSVGDRPIVKVELKAKEGYRFSYTSRSHFSLSGCDSEYKNARLFDSGQYMELYVYLKRIGGKLTSVENNLWDGMNATWDALAGSKNYQIRLYRDNKTVDTVETAQTSFNFNGYMTKEGYYSFRVRAIASYNGKEGAWSDYSDEHYISKDEAERQSGSSRWVQNQRGWWYSYGDGTYPVNCWKNINNAWYYFNGDGYMLTGWQFINNHWYYLGDDGAMQTSWRLIGNRWYYFDGSGIMLTGWQNIGGSWYYMDGSGAMLTGWLLLNNNWYYTDSRGVMQTGWQYIGGKWYYMDGSGVMYAGRNTPDGHYVDESGARVY